MKFYMAPMEGITGYLYRNAYEKCFGEIDKYFTPFISPNQKTICRTRERNDILPEHNQGMNVVPQILTNHAEMFQKTVNYLKDFGYEEVNLNLGCPVGTVVSKRKGAGFLAEKDKLRSFLDEIYSNCDIKISIKTRIGMTEPDEFDELLDIYNEYPIYELIIHPRTREDFYKGEPNLDKFEKGYLESRNQICYNGNIFTKEHYSWLIERFPNIESVMLGRGILKYPGLINLIKMNKKMTIEQVKEFHNILYDEYKNHLFGDKTVLFKMKELWSYMIYSFDYDEKIEKRIKKTQRLCEYKDVIRELFSNYDLMMI